jgi:glucose/arabinose dehydrogenase
VVARDPAKHLQLVADGLSFPTSLAFDDTGAVYVAESGLPFDGAPPGGRIWRLHSRGKRRLIAQGLHAPVNGITFFQGGFYVSEGGHPACISRVDRHGHREVILDGLPGPGNYHTNMVVVGPDGKLYFSQGAMTNTSVVGLDSYEIGWLRRLPHAHDLPGYPIVLDGVAIETENPLGSDTRARVRTGPFAQFGRCHPSGSRIEAELPCTAALMRCNPDGSDLDLVAWGLRNAYGLGFLPDGRLLATDQGADDRGSRPVGNAPDLLFEIRPGAWYGWPDFIGADPITDDRYQPQRGSPPVFVLANHDQLPPPERPLVRFPSHCAATKFDCIPTDIPEWGGQLFCALFGDERPMTAPPGPPAGRSIVRIDLSDWSIHDFMGPPLLRPIDIRFNGPEQALYILDFGTFEMHDFGVVASANSGRLWRLPVID